MDDDEDPLAGVTITLLDETGRTVATTQTDQEGRYRFDDLIPGDYTVVETQPIGYFEGGAKSGSKGGVIDSTNRISQITLGSGEVAVDYDFCERPPAEISGVVYLDRDADCVRDAGERGLDGVLVELLDLNGNVIATTRTLSDGTYRFSNLEAGEYQVREVQPLGFIHGGQVAGSHGGDDSQADLISSVQAGWGDTLTEYNFCELEPAEISGVVYLDRDADCVRDSGERGLDGVLIELLNVNGDVIETTFTAADGTYLFTNLPAGEYQVRQQQPAGFIHGGQVAGSHGGNDSQTDLISSVLAGWGDSLTQYNFCELEPSEISGVVYVDRDHDCVQDSGEVGLSGVLIELYDDTGRLVGTTTTGIDGTYQFTGLSAGNYTVRETQPDGYFQGGQVAGSGGGDTSVTDVISSIPLAWGESLSRYDFCERLPSTLEGKVWSDTNANRVFDAGEAPLPDVFIELKDSNGNVVAVTRTDADGCYKFVDLAPDTYTVTETQPLDHFQGGQVIGDQGGNVLGPDILGEIILLGGINAREYNFPELPPAKLSGFVFQDGENLVLEDAPPPEQLRQYRDGVLTQDDTRLSGVKVQLRDIFGVPVSSATNALPGIYADSVIEAVTDENGYYEFTGIRPLATYSVFQIQPGGFIDSLDTAGSTGGLALNRADLTDLELLAATSQLNPGVEPSFDAILQLVLQPGAVSTSNNFSEIVIEPPPEIPPRPEPESPQTPQAFAPIETFDTQIRPVAFAEFVDLPNPVMAADEWAVSWHLSVINGGFPRGDGSGPPSGLMTGEDRGAEFRAVAYGTEMQVHPTGGQLPKSLLSVQLVDGRWQVLDQDLSHLSIGHEDATALTGDFDGDGIDEAVLFLAGRWYIDLNGNGVWDAGDLWVRLGTEMDRPVVGDWDGDGKDDVGIFGRRWHNDEQRIRRDPGLPDPANQRRRELRREDLVHREPTDEEKRQRILARGEDGEFLADAVDHVFQYGEQVDTPVAGDWNGDGIDQIGVFRSGQWLLDEDGDGRWTRRDKPLTFGQPGDEPVVGDFNGDGIDEIAVVRGDLWIIDTDGDRRITGNDKQVRVPRESADAQPIVGDFDGDELDDPGYYDAS